MTLTRKIPGPIIIWLTLKQGMCIRLKITLYKLEFISYFIQEKEIFKDILKKKYCSTTECLLKHQLKHNLGNSLEKKVHGFDVLVSSRYKFERLRTIGMTIQT